MGLPVPNLPGQIRTELVQPAFVMRHPPTMVAPTLTDTPMEAPDLANYFEEGEVERLKSLGYVNWGIDGSSFRSRLPGNVRYPLSLIGQPGHDEKVVRETIQPDECYVFDIGFLVPKLNTTSLSPPTYWTREV